MGRAALIAQIDTVVSFTVLCFAIGSSSSYYSTVASVPICLNLYTVGPFFLFRDQIDMFQQSLPGTIALQSGTTCAAYFEPNTAPEISTFQLVHACEVAQLCVMLKNVQWNFFIGRWPMPYTIQIFFRFIAGALLRSAISIRCNRSRHLQLLRGQWIFWSMLVGCGER